MARIPKRLHGPAQLSGSAATKYTCPSSQKAVIRHIHASNPSGSAVTLTISIGTDGATTRIFDAYSMPAGSTLDHFGSHVLEAGEILQAFAGTASTIVLVVNGDEIVLG